MNGFIKETLLLTLILTISLSAKSQVFYNNGAAIMISSAAIVQVNGSMQNQSGSMTVSTGADANVYITGDLTNNSTITDHGNIHLNGNWINNATFNCSTGEVLLEGGNQNLSGTTATTFYDLTLLGTGIKTQTINKTTSGTLKLNDRELATENFTMFVTNTAVNAIQRTSGFVSSLGTGSLSRNTNLASTYLFPTGSSVGTTRYRPVELTPANTSANTYTVRLANVEAGTESFDRSLKPTEICLLNPNFYHRINRTSGSTAVNMNIYYDETADGAWQGIANWTTTPQWQIVAGSSTSAGTPMNKASVNNWNTFSTTPYILYTGAVDPTITSTDIDYCTGDAAVNLTATTAGGTWSGTGITNATAGTFNPATAGAGTHTITYSITGDCPATDDIILTVNTSPNVDLGADQTYCIGEIATINAGNAGANYQWSNGETSQSISTTTSGTYTVTVSNGNCQNTDQVVITFSDQADATITSTDIDFCSGDAAINLTATTAGGTWSGTGITNATAGTFNPATAGAGTFTISYTISGSCGDTDDIILTVNTSPNVDLGANISFCEGESATLDAGNAGATYLWNNGETSQTISINTAGTYSVTVSNGTCTDTDEITASYSADADATITTNILSYCNNGAPITLNAVTAGGTWSGDGITNANQGSFSPAAAGIGTHTITYTIPGNCGDTDNIDITVVDAPSLILSAEDETCDGANNGKAWITQISNGIAPFSILWSNDATTDTISNLRPDTYNVNITDASGCTATNMITINSSTVECNEADKLFIPNAFSPNGDGLNDVFTPSGDGIDIDTWVLRIYDRWGKVIFASTDINKGWDGRISDTDIIVQGVYVYTISFLNYLGEEREYLGRITLIF